MFAVKFFRTLKRNPKKSLVGGFIFSNIGYSCFLWARDRYKAGILLRAECVHAKNYGNMPIHHLGSLKRVTVFLNPAANDGKAANFYQKYAAPILHLAGLDVHLVTLEFDGQAKQLISIVDNTDMIIVAGGDGTLTEVVTGLLRRPDNKLQKIPIGVIPLGKKNRMCHRLYGDLEYDSKRSWICHAASSIVAGATCPVDVMKIQPLTGKPVYALSDIRWGSYCDLQEKIDKYWYIGRLFGLWLQPYIPFLMTSMKNPSNKARHLTLSYTDPENVPVPEENYLATKTSLISLSSILSNLFSRLLWRNSSKETETEADEEETEQKAELWHDLSLSTMQFVAVANNHLNATEAREKAEIEIMIESDTVSPKDYITKGPFTVQKAKHVPINVANTVTANKFTLSSSCEDEDQQFFSIDNDRYEAKDIAIELLPNCIEMVRYQTRHS